MLPPAALRKGRGERKGAQRDGRRELGGIQRTWVRSEKRAPTRTQVGRYLEYEGVPGLRDNFPNPGNSVPVAGQGPGVSYVISCGDPTPVPDSPSLELWPGCSPHASHISDFILEIPPYKPAGWILPTVRTFFEVSCFI